MGIKHLYRDVMKVLCLINIKSGEKMRDELFSYKYWKHEFVYVLISLAK